MIQTRARPDRPVQTIQPDRSSSSTASRARGVLPAIATQTSPGRSPEHPGHGPWVEFLRRRPRPAIAINSSAVTTTASPGRQAGPFQRTRATTTAAASSAVGRSAPCPDIKAPT